MEEKQIVIFIDSGDTIVDEASQVFIEGELVETAEYIPGAREALAKLREQGYKVIMVADGLRQSFINVHQIQHDAYGYFDGYIYSEDIGVCKPHRDMFEAGLKAAGLTANDVNRVVMVGNNLERDIKGANLMNMTSIHIKWSKRYPTQPKDDSEVPNYTIENPMELLAIVDELERNYSAN